MRQTVTLYVPDGYQDADEFLKDCQFERAEVEPSLEGFGTMLAWITFGAPNKEQGVKAARALRIHVWGLENEIITSRKEVEQQRYENVKLYDDAKKSALELMTATDVFNELIRRLQWDGSESDLNSISIGEIRRAI